MRENIIIKDEITGKSYKGLSCPLCGGKEVYILHDINPNYQDDINKDFVFCRCENKDCRYIVWKNQEAYTKILPYEEKVFLDPIDAIFAWNKI